MAASISQSQQPLLFLRGSVFRSLFLLALSSGLLAVSTNVLSALPPNHQRAAEFQAILESPEVGAVFDIKRPIERIEYLGSGQLSDNVR